MARRPRLSRDIAMQARPLCLPTVRTEERDKGGLLVTVTLERKGWQRLLGFPSTIQKTFGLDLAGRQVYNACDGETPVRDIVRRFAARNSLNVAEAELAVTTFLKSLMAKGLVAMEVDRETGGKRKLKGRRKRKR